MKFMKKLFVFTTCLMIAAQIYAQPYSANDKANAYKNAAPNDENWTLKDVTHLSIFNSLFRAQGITTDDSGHFWFSSLMSIVETSSLFGRVTMGNLFAIPYSLFKKGSNHIGDLSYADGKLYAPVEDSKRYANPHIVVYDSNNLKMIKKVQLPTSLQKDGVPWVAVNSEDRVLYSSEYTDMDHINVYDINSIAPKGEIKSTILLHSVQGGKVHNGYLYLTALGAEEFEFSIYRMNLQTGEVIEVAKLPSGLLEVEGLTFSIAGNVETINVLALIKLNSRFGGIANRLKKVGVFTFQRLK